MRALLVALACLPVLALSAGCLREYEDPHYVRIVSVDLQPARVLSQDVVLNVTSVLDNRGGGDSGPIRLQAKAYGEDNGFLVAENETEVGPVAGDTTRPVSLQVMVPRAGSVRIDVAIFEEGQGKERASISARNLAALEPEVLDTGLRVRDVDFLVEDVATDGANRTRVRVQTDLYVTNEGSSPSEDLRVQVKAREVSTRLVSDVAWVDTGSIIPSATVIRSTNLSVADGYNYVFEILTWRGDVVVARNEGTVQLAPTFVKPADQEVVTTNPNVNDFLRGPVATTAPTATYPTYGGGPDSGFAAEPRVPGPGAALVVLGGAIAVALFAITRRRSA